MLRRLRGDTQLPRSQDFEAQLEAVEGAVLRQKGRLRESREQLERARDVLMGRSYPWYLFWEPLQVEAHWLLAHFVDPDLPFAKSIQLAADHLRTPGVLQWSRDAALVVLAQAALSDVLFDYRGPEDAMEAVQEGIYETDIDNLIRQLDVDSSTKDPTWHSECVALTAAWAAACGQHATALSTLDRLARLPMSENLSILRALEVAILSDTLLAGQDLPESTTALRHSAQESLTNRRSRLESYSLGADHQEWATNVLNGDAGIDPSEWSEAPMQRFRAVLWP